MSHCSSNNESLLRIGDESDRLSTVVEVLLVFGPKIAGFVVFIVNKIS